MEEALSTIEKLIAEHRQIKDMIKSCEVSASDLEQRQKLDVVKENLVPGRLEDIRKKVAQLERELSAIDASTTQHFFCEEEQLLSAFETSRMPKLAVILTKLVAEHDQIRKHLANLIKESTQLVGDQSSVNIWHDRAWRLRKGIFALGEQIKQHSGKEDALFKEAKKALQEKKA